MINTNKYNVQTNPAVRFYDKASTVFNQKTGAPQTNIFTSYTTRMPAYGTVFGVHGYGGSPVQSLMISARDAALNHGFNFVALESYNISAISHRHNKQESADGTMRSFCEDIDVGVATALTDNRLKYGHKIAWAHCLGCRTIMRNYMINPETSHIFDEFVLCEPYFLPERKLLRAHMAAKRSNHGKAYFQRITYMILEKITAIFTKQHIQQRELFRILESILRTLPPDIVSDNGDVDIEKYVGFIFRETALRNNATLRDKPCTLILAGADTLVENDAAAKFYKHMPMRTKSTIMLRNEDHNMTRDKSKYHRAADDIMRRAQTIIDLKNGMVRDLQFDKSL